MFFRRSDPTRRRSLHGTGGGIERAFPHTANSAPAAGPSSRQSAARQGKKALSPQLHRKTLTTAVDKPQLNVEAYPVRAEKDEVKAGNLATEGYPQHNDCLVDKLHVDTATPCG